MLVFAAIMPHPLESVPGIGDPGGLAVIGKTLDAFEKLRKEIEEADPDTLVIISPHAHMEKFAFVINSEKELRGTLSDFGSDAMYEYENNIEMSNKIGFACSMNDTPCRLHGHFLDHGTLIPLHHLTKNIKPKLVHLSFSLMSYDRHYKYGEIIQKIVGSGGRVAVIASGDLSHRLTENALAGFSPMASAFDHSVMRYLGGGDIASLMGISENDALEVRECGIRSIMILLGILHGKQYKFDLLNYEGPTGIGYLTARLL